MSTEDYEVLQVEVTHPQQNQFDAVERSNVDSQVATAKQYPRNVRRSTDDSIAIATMDKETAESCGYALLRGGKSITGPSVHLAKIIVSNWGNIRTEAKVVQTTEKQVVSRGTCWDLEKNIASAFEVRRSIVDRNGKRFSEDMVTVTGNAANSIAYRNAVFSVIPEHVTKKVYQAAQKFFAGDLSDEDTLIKRRRAALDFFEDEYGIKEDEVLKICGRQTINQIKTDELVFLIRLQQSLKDGDTDFEQLMNPIRGVKEAIKEKKETMRKGKKDKTTKPNLP